MAERRIRVLIVQREPAFAQLLAMWLMSAGFEAVGCPEPDPSNPECVLMEQQAAIASVRENSSGTFNCPAVEDADALVYDPWLYVAPHTPDARGLIRALRQRYPRQPLIFAWADEGMPSFDPDISSEPGVYIAPRNLAEIVRLVGKVTEQPTGADRRG